MVDLLIRGANVRQLQDETASVLYKHDILVIGNRAVCAGL